MKNIIFLAPPGAGKGTQADLVSKYYNIPAFSCGDLLRKARDKQDDISKIIEEKQDRGEFVDDHIVLEVIKRRLAEDDTSEGFIIDGYPRTLEQAKKFDQIMSELNRKVDLVINLDVDYETLKQRIIGRQNCPNCGSIYNELIASQRPQQEGICDNCHTELTKRTDDNEEAFKVRYNNQMQGIKPIIAYYAPQNIVHTVDGAKSKEDIFNELKEIINN